MSQSRGSLITTVTRLFSSRSRASQEQSPYSEENNDREEEIGRIKEEKNGIEAQLKLTQDKLHREQDRAQSVEVDFRRQAVQLREAGVAKEELRCSVSRLEEQLRRRGDELRMQEEDMLQLRMVHQQQAVELGQAREQLTISQHRFEELSRAREEELSRARDEATLAVKRKWAEQEATFNLERLAFEKMRRQLQTHCENLEKKNTALDQENVKLFAEIQQLKGPPVSTVRPREYLQNNIPADHECWRLSAVQLLQKCDDLVSDMASNLSPTCINGSTSDWKHLCAQLKINSTSLYHIDDKQRLISIIQQHEQQTPGPLMSVKSLHDVLSLINARRAASQLVLKAHEVCKPPKRSASESHAHTSVPQRAAYNSSHSFSHASRQDALLHDRLFENDTNGSDYIAAPISISSIEDGSVEIIDTESPQHV